MGGGVSGMTGVYRRQPGIQTGKHQGLKYRIPISAKGLVLAKQYAFETVARLIIYILTTFID
jgi:hypothetical protein